MKIFVSACKYLYLYLEGRRTGTILGSVFSSLTPGDLWVREELLSIQVQELKALYAMDQEGQCRACRQVVVEQCRKYQGIISTFLLCINARPLTPAPFDRDFSQPLPETL